jgi:hypothetical protein
VVSVPDIPVTMVMRTDGDFFRVVAPAYVHGIMGGKSWEQLYTEGT